MKLLSFIHILLILLIFTSPSFAEESSQQIPEQIPLQTQSVSFNNIINLPKISSSLSMEDAVNISLENNLNILIAESDNDVKTAYLKLAKAQRYPTLLLGSLTFVRAGNSLSYMTPEMMMNMGNSRVFQDFNLSLKLPLFTGGKITSDIKGFRNALEASDAVTKQTMADTSYQIRNEYLKTLLSIETIKVIEEEIKLQQELLSFAELKYKSGKTTMADPLRVKSRISELRQQLNDENINLNDLYFEIKALLVVDMDSNISLKDDLSSNILILPERNSINKFIEKYNPRIMEAKKLVLEKEALVRSSKSGYFPQINGLVSGNVRIPDDTSAMGMGSGMVGFLSASLPVFDKSRSAKIAIAKSELIKAQQMLKAVQVNVIKEIAQLYSEYDISKQNIELAEDTIKSAEEDLRILKSRYEVGRSILVEVEDASILLQKAKLDKLKAIYNNKLNQAKLLKGTGLISPEELVEK